MSEADDPTFPYDIEQVIEETITRTLIRVGIDISDPIEVQKDLAHLRSWREGVEGVKNKGIAAAVGVLVVGILGLIWSAFRSAVH